MVDTIPYWIDTRVITMSFEAEKTLTKDTVPVEVDCRTIGFAGRTIMKRHHLLFTGTLVVGMYACTRADGVGTTTTTSVAIPRKRLEADVYRSSRELDRSDPVTMTARVPSAVEAAAAAAPPTTARRSKRAGNEEPEPLTAPAPVGPGGFVPGPLGTAGAFVPGPLDDARGFGPERVNPGRDFTPAPLDWGL